MILFTQNKACVDSGSIDEESAIALQMTTLLSLLEGRKPTDVFSPNETGCD
jgi:hypothetical protein